MTTTTEGPNHNTANPGPRQPGKQKVITGSATKETLAHLYKPEPADVADLAERMRDDYQIKLAELTLSSNIRQADVSVTVTNNPNDDPRADAVSDQLRSLWERSLRTMMAAIGDGRVAYEKVWEYNPQLNISYIRKLQALPYRNTTMELNQPSDPDPGAFKGIKLTGGAEPITLTPDKSWWLSIDATATEPHGRSRFIGAPHRTFKDREEALRLRNVFLRRFALGGGIAHVPETVVNENGETVDVFQAVADAFDDLQAGGVMALPNDRTMPDGTGEYVYDFTNVNLEVRDSSPLTNLISQMDSEQLLAFGIPPKTVIEGDAVGSFALVTQQMLLLFSVVEDLLDQFVESFEMYVVKKTVDENWMDDPSAPVFAMSYSRLTDRPDDMAVELVKGWLTMPGLSPVVLSGAIDVFEILDMVGIAVADDARDRLSAMINNARALNDQAVIANVPPPNSGMGNVPPDGVQTPETTPQDLPNGVKPPDPGPNPPSGGDMAVHNVPPPDFPPPMV